MYSITQFFKNEKNRIVLLYYQGGLDVENTTTGNIENADWKSQKTLLSLQQLPGRNIPVSSKDIRLNVLLYFNSEQGAVPWQYIINI